MAAIYVRSSDGNNSDNGSTWALAKASVGGASGAASIESAGDDIYVADGHSESYASSTTISIGSAYGTPTRMICVDDTSDPEPPTAAATGAQIVTTGSSNLTIDVGASAAGNVYVEGIRFRAGDSTGTAILNVGTTSNFRQTNWMRNCNLELGGSGSSAQIRVTGGTSPHQVMYWDDVWVKFANSAHYLSIAGSVLHWEGGGLESGGTSPSFLVGMNQSILATVTMSNLDLTAASAGMHIFNIGGSINASLFGYIRNSKLPSSWTGALTSGTADGVYRCEMHNCTSGSTLYRLWVQTPFGSIRDNTTIYRTGGAEDNGVPVSLRMVSASQASFWMPLVGHEITRFNDAVGAPITVSVEIVTDNVTLTDAECWLEVQYLGTGGQGATASDRKSNTLGSAANQTSSSVSWTTTGLTTPVKQTLSVTFTPEVAGHMIARVMLGRASTTVYVDPKLTIS